MLDHSENEEATDRPDTYTTSQTLPDVQPPQAGFLVQLFLIPMVIVAAIICVWLLFNVISQSESPTELVRGLRKMDSSSWQKAYTLSNLLRTPNSKDLKNDPELAAELVSILESPFDVEKADPNQVKLRVFVCRCLGELEIPEGMDALISAMQKTDNESEIEIGRTAVESLSILIKNLGPQSQRRNKELLAALVDTSNIQTQNAKMQLKVDQLRSTIGFALGVLGGEEAIRRLQGMLSDSFPNARFNAAAGLARHGDLSCKNVLLEMLDAESESVVAGEEHQSSHQFKRSVVATTAIGAVSALSEHCEISELSDLIPAVRAASETDAFGGKTKVLAKELLVNIQKS
ncbi:MAG: hypothetical protein CMJ76_04225 [Planctomycetaceae bacterium]|nr:hypothetical protein [Planctomycetaceae bacterium]